MKTSIITVSALSVFSLSTAIAAQPDGSRGDLNGDGKVSRDEMLTSANARFTDTDINQDGYLTKEEIKAAGEENRKKRIGRRGDRQENRFAEADMNDDGQLSLQETTDQAIKRFEKLDSDNNGQLTEEEMRSARKQYRSDR
ncbi:MAG: hypothetical protein AAF603_05985 [Pseudomonadota bacterium]